MDILISSMHGITALIVLILVLLHLYLQHGGAQKCANRTDMRRLWVDHAVYTRLYLLAAINQSDKQVLEAVATRLMRNQDDIGNYISTKYPGRGPELAKLLKEHVTLFVEAVKSRTEPGDQEKAIMQKLMANSKQISDYLKSLNSSWDVKKHFNEHVHLTLKEINLISSHAAREDIKNFDLIMTSIYEMADILV